MTSQTMPAITPEDQRSLSNQVNAERPIIGGSFRKGVEKLVKAIERRVDQQVLSAQIRAYDTSPVTPAKSSQA